MSDRLLTKENSNICWIPPDLRSPFTEELQFTPYLTPGLVRAAAVHTQMLRSGRDSHIMPATSSNGFRTLTGTTAEAGASSYTLTRPSLSFSLCPMVVEPSFLELTDILRRGEHNPSPSVKQAPRVTRYDLVILDIDMG